MLYIHADSFLVPQSKSNLNHIIINRYENSLVLWNITKVGTLAQRERIRLGAHFPNDLPPNPTFLLLLDVQFSRSDLIFYTAFILDHSMAREIGDVVICVLLVSVISSRLCCDTV